MSNEKREAALREHHAAENAHDVDRVLRTYAEGAVVELNGIQFSGERIKAFHDRFGFGGHGDFSEITVTPNVVHHVGDSIIVELKLSGVHSGNWHGLAPTGKRFEVVACTVYQFDAHEKLVSERLYMDFASIRRQLVPPAA